MTLKKTPETTPKSDRGIIACEEYNGQESTLVNMKYQGEKYIKIEGKRLSKFKKIENLTISNTSVKKIPVALGKLKKIVKLNFPSNQIEYLPSEIGKLEDCQIFHMPWNSLKILPYEIGNLKNLKELNLTDNKLTSLPTEIKNLENLQKLLLANNKLTELPEEIGSLKMLEKLDLASNRLKKLPESFGNLKILEELFLSYNHLEDLPDEIGNLTGLKSLFICSNRLREFPIKICNLNNLKELQISRNFISEIPSCIENLNSLKFFNLSENFLKNLPDQVGRLSNLLELNLNKNALKTLPGSIGELKFLQKLFLEQNFMIFIPTGIKKLKNLQTLNLENNQIVRLEEIEKLTKLKKLNIDQNQLEFLPKEINKLVNLEKLYVSNNKLTALPSELSELKKLQELHVNINYLTAVPSTFKNLKKTLLLLNLENNMINAEGENGTFGRSEIETHFGTNAKFDNIGKNPTFTVKQKEVVLKSLKTQKLHWNVEMLRTFFNNAVPKGEMTEKELLELWNCKISSLTTKENSNLFINYIKKLYNPDNEYILWAMKSEFIPTTINLIQAITKEFCLVLEEMNEQDSFDIIRTNIHAICEGIKKCPDRQMAELRFAYNILRGEPTNEGITLDSFVNDFIAAKKEQVFDFVFTPAKSKQNVHVLNYWKRNLKDELGFNFSFDSKIGTMGNDPFRSEPGNALEAFFTRFTPDLIITLLTQSINSNKKMLCQSIEYIYNSEIDLDRKKEMIDAEDFEFVEVSSIKREFVQYYLMEKGILEENIQISE